MNQVKNQDLTFEDFVGGFCAIGLVPGDTVLVQSSFAEFRRVRGGPKTVIEALLEVLQPDGTLIMPTFNWVDFGAKKFYSKRKSKPQKRLKISVFRGSQDPGRPAPAVDGG